MNKRAILPCFILVILFFCTACSAIGTDIAGNNSENLDLNTNILGNTNNTSKLDPSKPLTLTLWHYYTSESQVALEEAIKNFNQTIGLQKGVIVEPVAMGSISDLEEAVTFSAKGVINSAPMPDIFSCYADKALELDKLGSIADLSKYFTLEEQNEYVKSFIEDGTFEGRLLILPIVKSTELLYVNKSALDMFLNSPVGAQYSTKDLDYWESLYNLCKGYYEWTDAKTPDKQWDGKAFMGYDAIANYIILGNKQLGVDIIDGNKGEVILNKQSLKKIFDIYYSGITLGYFDEVGKFRSDDVKAGDLASYVGSSSSAAYFPTWTEENGKQLDIELLACSYPTFTGTRPYSIQQGAGMAVSKSDEAKEEGAAIFLKWFTDVSENVKFAMTTGYLPVKSQAYVSTEFENALEDLSKGDTAKKNVGKVYSIALHQIRDADTYAAKPFDGSYNVRNILKNSILDSGKIGRELAAQLKEAGLTGEEILAQLDMDSKFEDWLNVIKSELTDMSIKFKVE